VCDKLGLGHHNDRRVQIHVVSTAAELLKSLKDVAPGTIDYKVGINFRKGPASAEVCPIGVFEDRQAFDTYMSHPHHRNVVSPGISKLIGGDFTARASSCDFEVGV